MLIACTNDTAEREARTTTLLPAESGDSLEIVLAARQRAFFDALSMPTAESPAFLMPEFKTFNELDSSYADWEQPPIFGHDVTSLRELAARLGPEQLEGDLFEVLPYRDGSVAVISFRSTRPPNLTAWVHRDGAWKARGMRINASDRHIRPAPENSSRARAATSSR
jgi:hypothetical protein